MSSVVDASVLVSALIDKGADGAWATTVLAAGPLYTPELGRAEAMNILHRLEKAKLISILEANAAQGDLIKLNIQALPFEPFAHRIWELRHTVTGYDAWYVAVAEAFDLPLATLDKRLIKASGPTCSFLMP